ncbi:cytochrome c biogenesis protein ResB [Coriobacteriia bacterium Es71-Z0120]|uniref:cytochrome c biogenesis protein ResB n=1 Tax=Parvivirga hydrogeniphila TaxID=2939460 RepID=UPI002260C1F8|nr:cytochrome c biogenesis protein ResB [Parvivirga hydrogeniphila]MCL4079183.1 cytochrome c biogenesis protein ResB [Parvivirga hydrogeniphila]
MRTPRVLRLLSQAGSVRLAAWLIAALGALSIVSVVVPQRAYLGAAYEDFAHRAPAVAKLVSAVGLDRVYGGWPIAVVTALLGVNLTVCTVRRVSARRRSSSREGAVPAEFAAFVSRALGEGWTVLRAGPRSVTLVKGRSGFWGSAIMHAGLIVVIIGGVATSVTAFRGQAVIAEGQTVRDEPSAYETVGVVPRVGPAYRGTRITLDSMHVAYERGTVVSAVARMRAVQPDGRIVRKDVRVNHPLDAGGKSWLLQDSGYVARVVVRVDGRQALPLAVKLASETPYGWRDDIVVKTDAGDVALSLSATPRPVSSSDEAVEEKLAIRDPRLAIVVEHADARWEGVLAPGESSGSVGGATVIFEGLGLWSRFLVRGEPARWVTYAGFWLVVLGAMWRFAVPERRAVVQRGEDGALQAVLRVYPWMQTRAGEAEVVCLSCSQEMERRESSEEGSRE